MELKNFLVGDDYALLEFREGTSSPDLIEVLLDAVASSGLVFFRNGKQYDAQAAADHWRSKRDYAEDRVSTARDFIEQIASRSSMSGKPYRVQLEDGSVVPTREWLLNRLKELEARGR